MPIKIYCSIFILSFCLLACKKTAETEPHKGISDNTPALKSSYAIAFYNVENLYDTERDYSIHDEEFTPNGVKEWTSDKYKNKLNNISYVIRQIEQSLKESKLAFIGLAEIENKKVLKELVSQKQIKDSGYKFIHQDSPDPRGIDVALIYNPAIFTVVNYKSIPYQNPKYPHYQTRDILLVKGQIKDITLHILVTHWISRKGENNMELRDQNAHICKQVCDSLYQNYPDSKIILMGDLNDNPPDRSCRAILKAKRDKASVKKGELYNPFWNMYQKGLGTSQYRDKWDMFDQIIISESLLNNKLFRFKESIIYNKDFLIQKDGKYKGYPLRSFSGNTFINGYSDHFPVIVLFESLN
jgi:endonuclease/exonuclease/phosphatase family metal-dependent hydrolase